MSRILANTAQKMSRILGNAAQNSFLSASRLLPGLAGFKYPGAKHQAPPAPLPAFPERGEK
jgi:hypothetical protein